MPNRFKPIPPGTSQEQKDSIINQNFAQLDGENTLKVMYGSDGVPRVLIDSTTGVIKVAPSGVDVTTAEDRELDFVSTRSSIRSVKEVVETFPSATATVGGATGSAFGSNTVPVAHGLDFVPALLPYSDNSVYDASVNPKVQVGVGAGYMYVATFTASVDATNVYFKTEVAIYGAAASTVTVNGSYVRFLLLQANVA